MPFKARPKSEVEEQLKAIPNSYFIGWSEEYRSMATRASLLCTVHGVTREATASDLLRKAGCKECGYATMSRKRGIPVEEVIRGIESHPGIRFLRFDGSYVNVVLSKATVSCVCGKENTATVSSLLKGSKCAECASSNRSDKQRTPQAQREEQIAKMGVQFLEWVDGGYKNWESPVRVSCTAGHSWETSVNRLMRGCRCPECAKTGFDPGKAASLYFLMSGCGRWAKVGISNTLQSRLSKLKRATPFATHLVHHITSSNGHHIRQLEVEAHKLFESAGFTGFDGATEWLKVTDELLQWVMDKSKEASSL